MKLSRKFYPLILFSFLLLSVPYLFGLSISPANQIDNSPSDHPEQPTFVHPCEVITIEVLKKVLQLDNIEVANKESGSSFPTCRYVWDGDNKQVMTIGGNKTELDIECNVTIVIVDMIVSKINYDASIKSYSDATELLGIGDHAVWSDKRKQMTVLAGKNLFHVHVDFVSENEINKEKAIALSEIIIASF